MPKETKDVLVRNVPVTVIEDMKKQAEDNYRSMNNQIIAVLEASSKEAE